MIRRPINLLALCIILSIPAVGQSTKTIKWQQGNIESDKVWGFEFFIEGYHARAISTHGLTVGVILYKSKKHIVALVGIINQTQNNVNVIPTQFTLDATAPKQKRLAYQNPYKIAEKVEKEARNNAFWTVLGAAMLSQYSTTTGNSSGTITGNIGNVPISGTYSGSSSSTTRQPNTQIQELAINKGNETIADGQQTAHSIISSALKANTVFANQNYVGYVYFEGSKSVNAATLRIPIQGYVIELPFEF